MTLPLRPIGSGLARLALCGLLATCALPAWAQDPEPTADPRLPSLTPREFEIRGDVRVDLPGIERQPLTGFGPPPRTYVVPADRAALTGAYDPNLDALPPLVLAAPAEPVTALPTPRFVRAEGTYGTEAARTGRVDISIPVASGQLLADVDYDGLGATTDRENVAFDRLAGTAMIRTGGRFPVGVGGSLLIDRYGLPGVADIPTNAPTPLRRLTRAGGTVELGSANVSPLEARVRFVSDRLEPASEGAERLVGPDQSAALIDGTARLTLFNRLRLEGGVGAVGLDGGPGDDARYASAGASILLGSNDGLEAMLGARALTYDVPLDVGGTGQSLVFSPIVDISIPVAPGTRILLSNDPRLVVRGLGDLVEANPFVKDRPVVAPDLLRVDVRAGAELSAGPLTLRGFALLTEAPTYLYFVRSADGRYNEIYDDVLIQGLTAEGAVVFASGISFDAAVTVRETELTASVGDVPYIAPLTARAGIQIPFSRGRVAMTAYHESERPTGTPTDAPGFTLVSADARIDLSRQLSVLVQADRLAGTVQEWPGYPVVASAVRAGLRVTL